MNKIKILTSSLIIILNSCQVNTINADLINKKKETIIDTKQNNALTLISISNQMIVNGIINNEPLTDGGFITINYNDKFVDIPYELKNNKIKAKDSLYKLSLRQILNNPSNSNSILKNNSIPIDSEKNTKEYQEKINNIISEIKSLKTTNDKEKSLLEIAINIIDNKEFEVYYEKSENKSIENNSFIKFTKISDNEFKLQTTQENTFISLINDKDNSKFYIKEGTFIIDDLKSIFNKETGYSLNPSITLIPEQKIYNIDTFGRVYVKYINQQNKDIYYNISTLSISTFKDSSKLSKIDNLYIETIDSGKEERIDLSNIVELERNLKIK